MQATYAADGVVVMDLLEDATSTEMLNTGAWATATYPVMRTDPNMQAHNDYAASESWLGSPMIPLIDLETMEVLVVDVWPPSTWASTIESHL